jgi:hypothetical protein
VSFLTKEALTFVSCQQAVKKISQLPDGSQHRLKTSERSSAKNAILAASSFKNAWEGEKKANEIKKQK